MGHSVDPSAGRVTARTATCAGPYGLAASPDGSWVAVSCEWDGTVRRVDPKTLATSAPGVFAGGDVAFGPRNLIEAVANGKTAALSIDNYMRGADLEPEAWLWIDKIPTRAYSVTTDYEKLAREAPETTDLQHRTGISEVELGYREAEARRQAERCLRCHIQTIYDAEKCVLCNRCVDICPEYCLKLAPLEQLDWDEETAARVKELYGTGGLEPLSAMIKDDEKCIRCGLCAVRCPTDAMTMEIFFYEESDASAQGWREAHGDARREPALVP